MVWLQISGQMFGHGCWQSREQRMCMAHSTPESPAPWRPPSLSPLFLLSGWRQTQPGPLLPVDTNLLTEFILVAHKQSEIRWCFKHFNKVACLEQKPRWVTTHFIPISMWTAAVSSRKRCRREGPQSRSRIGTSHRIQCWTWCLLCTSLVHRNTASPLGYTWQDR